MSENDLSESSPGVCRRVFKKVREKAGTHLRRYWLAEVLGTATAYGGYFGMVLWNEDPIYAAYAGSLSENVGFYGTMIVKDLRTRVRGLREKGRRLSPRDVGSVLRDLVVEFGASEVVDSFITRPVCIGAGAELIGGELGVGVGKIAADALFYTTPIAVQEIRAARKKKGEPC